jgi:integrase
VVVLKGWFFCRLALPALTVVAFSSVSLELAPPRPSENTKKAAAIPRRLRGKDAGLATDYTYGLRRSELLDLRVFQVDATDNVIRLNDDQTKNGRGRTVAMTPEVRTLLLACIENKNAQDYVFTRRDFREAWKNLLASAGLPLRLFHDNRRSAIRNMVRAGVDTTVAMKISGHKCDSVFRRYRIMDETDLHLAAQKIADGAEREKARVRAKTDTKTDILVQSQKTDEQPVQ